MASNLPETCCTIGVKHTGVPKGNFIASLGGVRTYIAKPDSGSNDNSVLLLSDVLGIDFVNTQLIADQFAANGYLCVVPDLFSGDPIPLNRPETFDMTKWREGPPSKMPDVVGPIVEAAINELRDTYHAKKIGAVGYCFGAKYAVRALGASGQVGVDAAYIAHPSGVEEDELETIKGPLSIAAAETDRLFPPEKRHKSEDILRALAQGSQSIAYQFVLYSHVVHGFAVRGDVSISAIKFAKEAAFLQAVQWFDYWLKGAAGI